MTCSHPMPDTSAHKLMKGEENVQFAMDQSLLLDAAAEPVADGTIQTRGRWVVKKGVINLTNYG